LLIQNKIEDRNRKKKQIALWRDNLKTKTNADVLNINQKIQEWVSGQIVPQN
jgi:hypothetical protein